MVVKLTNKDKKFYQYMGRFFGSRLIQSQTNDRVYDDDNKEWYIFIKGDIAKGFVSLNKDVIKNVYAMNDEYLEEILNYIKTENKITYSIVTNCYMDVYEKCGFKIYKNPSHKNFITIYMDEEMKSA